MLTWAPHPSYPGHCRWRNGMSNSPWDGKTAGYLDPHADGLILVRKNCGTPVHQKVTLAGKRKLCREVPPTSCRKRDVTRPAALDRDSMAV